MHKLNRFAIGLAVGLGAVSLLALATAYAQGSGVIKGCYNQQNGLLRIVSDAGECRQNEAALHWNAQGPQGVPGPQGPPGTGGASLDDHHEELTASVPNEQDFVIPLPEVDTPVKLDVAVSGVTAENAAGSPIQMPPVTFSLLVTVESSTGGGFLVSNDMASNAAGDGSGADPVINPSALSGHFFTVTLELPENNIRINTIPGFALNPGSTVTSSEVKYSVNMWH